jgi:hypothetical protein
MDASAVTRISPTIAINPGAHTIFGASSHFVLVIAFGTGAFAVTFYSHIVAFRHTGIAVGLTIDATHWLVNICAYTSALSFSAEIA